MKKKNPLLSIIIPTLNEEKYLPKLLNSIKKQNFKDYEIIVADYHSKDKTGKIARRFGCRIAKGGSPAKGRNKGARIARGDILLFLDADVILPTGFLSEMVRNFKKRELGVAACFLIPDSKNVIDRFSHFILNSFVFFFQFLSPLAPGPCIMVRKEFHEKVKGFDETLFMAEDHDYVNRISKIGRFRVINCKIIVSTRRIKKEGRLGIAWKYLYVFLHRLFMGEIRNKIFRYEFGKYK